MTYSIKKEPIQITVSRFEKANDDELKQLAQLEVKDVENNKDVSDLISFDKNVIDLHEFNQAQRLPIMVHVGRTETVEAGYVDLTLTKKHIFRYIFLIILIICLAGILTMCHQHKVNQQNANVNSQQNAQISSTNGKLNNAFEQIKALHQEVKDLKDAVQQYKQDQNKQTFDQQLQNIQQQINNMQQQQNIQNQEVKDLVQRLNNALNELINANPQQTNDILNKYHL